VKRKKRYKRKPYKPIDKDDFKEVRLTSRLTIEQTAKLLQVTSRTVALWECGSSRIPYSAFKLLRCLAKGDLIPEAWKGWTIKDETLYSPSGRSFRVYELLYLANYLTMARYWQADSERKSKRRQVAAEPQSLRVVAGRTFRGAK
jgi:transcriptional regulator with XRE-family HTH domain